MVRSGVAGLDRSAMRETGSLSAGAGDRVYATFIPFASISSGKSEASASLRVRRG